MHTSHVKSSSAWTTWPSNISFAYHSPTITSTTTSEIQAICTLTEMLTNNITLQIFTDSQATIDGFKNNITFRNNLSKRRSLQNSNWHLWEIINHNIIEKNLNLNLHKVKGHSNNPGNDFADTLAKSAPTSHSISINFNSLPETSYIPVFNLSLPITSNLRKFLKLQDNKRNITKWQLYALKNNFINRSFWFTIDWKATNLTWNQDKGINSLTASANASKFRTYFTKIIHDMLPTLSNQHKFYPSIYTHDTCNRCHLESETNNHLWTCPNSSDQIKSIITKSQVKLEKILIKHFSTTNTQNLSSSLNSEVKNFTKNSHFLNNADLSSNIGHKPGYMLVFKGFVPLELTNFINSLGPSKSEASALSAKFVIWFSKQGFTHIWLNRCNDQIKAEKSNSIFARHKRTSKKRTGRPKSTTSSNSTTNIFRLHMESNLCSCKHSASSHLNNQCPDEGLADLQGDQITSLIYTLQAENDLFINPVGFI